MYRVKKGILFSLFFCCLLYSMVAQSGIPVWTLEPLTSTQLTLSPGSEAVVQYQVTNQSHKIHHLRMRFIKGVIASGCERPIQYQQTCTLNLVISGSELQNSIYGGPVLCEQGNLNQCYQPAAGKGLAIQLSPIAQANISLSVGVLNFTLGGSYQAVQVTNNSAVNVENLQALIPPGSGIELDALNSTCTGILLPGAGCQYAFLPGNVVEYGTVITINGSNTNSTTVIANVDGAILDVPTTTINFTVGDLSPPLTINNTSATVTVNNLQLNNLPPELTIDPSSTCVLGGTLAPGDNCSFIFTALLPVSTSAVTVNGSNTNTVPITINATAPTNPILSISTPADIAILDTDGVSTLEIVVENTGGSTANNVTMSALNIAGAPWTNVTFNPTTCGNIIAGGSCSFTIQSNTPNLVGQVTIASTNAASVITPYIAFRYQGGLVFQASGGVAKMLAESGFSSVAWGTTAPYIPAAVSTIDGVTNTNAIVAVFPSGSNSYAANLCDTYTFGGYTDWYLPAICEWGNGGALGACGGLANIGQNLRQYGFGDFPNGSLTWSSSQYDTATPAFQAFAWYLNLTSAGQGFPTFGTKTSASTAWRVRCARQVAY